MKYSLNERDVKLYNNKDFGNKLNNESRFNLNIPSMSTFQIYDPNHDYTFPEIESADFKIWDPAANH